jgi:aryl-alcohol dehydrogenase-like predicted oxidoreductase
MTFAGRGFFKAIGQLGQSEADALVKRALDAGINFIDTADVYSEGESERMTGQALKNLGVKRSNVVVATKVHGRVGPGPNDTGSSRGHIMDSVRGSLERLQTDHIDLYQIHGHDVVAPVEETMRALEDLVRQGLVRYIGVSNWPAWRITQAQGVAQRWGWSRFETLQAYYTLTNRDLERELVPMMLDQSMGLMVWSPLAGGLLSGKFHRDAEAPADSRRASFDFPPVNPERLWRVLDVMRPIAEAHGCSCARVAVAWLLAKPTVMTVILGAKTTEQLDDTIAASSLSLAKEEMAKLDEASELAVEYPQWMLQRIGAGRRPGPVGPDRS